MQSLVSEEKDAMWNQLALSIQSGNVYTYIMLMLGFLGTVLITERYVMLQVVYNINFSKFILNLRKAIRAEDLDRAMHICKTASHTSLPKIGLKALEAAERDPTTIKGTIEEETIDFLPLLETRLSIIPTLATIILLMGVLATIDGLWGAFTSIEVLDTSEKQANLSHGIAGSLNPTVIGLVISMIFLAGHQVLQGIAVKITEKIHYGVTVLINLLVPQEMAYVATGPASNFDAPHDSSPMKEEVHIESAVAAPQKHEEEDDFDDSSVEDIKDEEEII